MGEFDHTRIQTYIVLCVYHKNVLQLLSLLVLVSMLSDCEDSSPHEAPRRPLAVLTKLPTRLPFRTSILSKSSETTHFVLPQYGQGGPRANLGDFTHPSTTQSGPGNRRQLQSTANVLRCPVYISPETSDGNQSPLKPFKKAPSQTAFHSMRTQNLNQYSLLLIGFFLESVRSNYHVATIPATCSQDTRLPLLQPIATTSQPTERPYPKSSRLPPQPARLSPLTDPNETKNLWAIVRKQIANTRAISSAGKEKAENGTFSYRDIELESRKITITESSLQPVYEWLPSIDQASGQELGGLYLDPTSNFAREIQDWALCFRTFDPPMSEYQWATDVFAKFLPVQMYPPRSKKDSIKLRRQQQPYVSITSGDYVLLPPKDLSVSTKASQNLGSIKRKRRISTLPKLDTKDGFGLNEPTEGSIVTKYKKGPSSRGVKPDFMYASSISLLKDYALYTRYPALRTFAYLDLLPPYIIGKFKNTKTKDMEARQPLALVGAMLLLERVKLRRLSSNPSLDDIRIFTLTCCGTLVTIDCMKIPPGNDKPAELLSFEMEWFRSFSLIDHDQIIGMANALNSIHTYGRTVHLQRILEDIQAIKGTRSFADIDKRAYEYKASNTFELGDELIILDEGNMARTMTPSESSSLEDQKGPSAIDPDPVACTSATNKSVRPNRHIPPE